MKPTITPVHRDQFNHWLRLRQTIYTGIDTQFHQQEMEDIYEDDTKTCMLATDETGNVIGFVEVTLRNIVDGCLTSPVGYIEGIYVDETHRGLGASRQLLAAAEEWCRAKGCREIATDAELTNESAQQFHRHMGFQETYRIVEFKKEL